MQPPDLGVSRRISLADVFRVETFFRHKWVVLLVSALVMALTVTFLFVRDRSFDSLTRMFVRLGRESVTVDPTAAATGQVLTLSDSQQREIQSVIDILESRGLMEQVVDTLGAEAILDDALIGDDGKLAESDPPSLAERLAGTVGETVGHVREALVPLKLADPVNIRAKAIEQLEKAIKVNSQDESNVVSLRVRAKSPALAQQLSLMILEKFHDQHLQAHRAPGAYTFFSEQTKRVKADLDQAMADLRDAKNQAGFAEVDAQKELLTNRLKEIELAIMQATSEYQGASAKSAEMETMLSGLPERVVSDQKTGLTNTSRDEMRGRLYQVELEEAQLRTVFTDEHPLVIQARERLREAQKVLGEERVSPEVTTSLNRAHQELTVSRLAEKSNMASASARLAELQKQRDEVSKSIQQVNSQELRIVELEREIAVLDAKYRRYAENLEQTRIDEALEASRMSSVNVIQPPTFSDDPVDVSNSLVALGGFLSSIICGLAAAMGLEFIRDDFSTPSDVERELALPVLASVPETREPAAAVLS